jgi:hypothetical protein
MTTQQNLECRVSVNLLLEAAHRLFSYDKVPFALALIHIVLEQYPDHPRAHMFYQVFTGASVPAYPISRMHRLYYDSETGIFFVGDKGSKGNIPFKTLEDAEAYLRGLK